MQQFAPWNTIGVDKEQLDTQDFRVGGQIIHGLSFIGKLHVKPLRAHSSDLAVFEKDGLQTSSHEGMTLAPGSASSVVSALSNSPISLSTSAWLVCGQHKVML